MKYFSTDRLSDFEFHDAVLSLVSWEKDSLIVSAKGLNVHKDAAPNNAGADMEIAEARIRFFGFSIMEFEPSRRWKQDENGRYYTDEPLVIHTDITAQRMFENELHNAITILFLEEDNGRYEIGAIGLDPYFCVRFTFSSVEVEWEDYRKKAWYELHRQYRKLITLSTIDGEIKAEAHIVCHDEDVYFLDEKKEIEGPSVSVGVDYNGKRIVGRGKDYLWVDAFADLQKRLPDGVKLKCCLTCVHGNMCPVGNKPGELFCTKDVLIQEKSDLFFCTENWDEKERRSVDYCDVCKDYREQTDDQYTYNDYLYYLH